MFEDEYRREMDGLRASESLIADTLKKMQEEQAKLQTQQPAGADGESADSESAAPAAAPGHSYKKKQPLFIRIGLPVAACLIAALLGVLIVPQVVGTSAQDSQQQYTFQPVQGNASFGGGLQFGGIGGNQPEGVETDLKRTECSESELPEGILDGEPVVIGGHTVYLGFDGEQAAYYAAYRESNSDDIWVVIQSTDLDEAGFIEALENYFS